MRMYLPAALFALFAAAAPALGQNTTALPPVTVPVGTVVLANVTYCTDETEAHNVLRAHRSSGLAAGIDYIVHSPVCRVAVMSFTVLRQLAEYPDLPLERGQPAKSFYVIEAVDAGGDRLFIVSMVKVVERYAET